MRQLLLSVYARVVAVAALLLASGLLVAPRAGAQIPTVPRLAYGFTVPGEIASPNGSEHFFLGCADETVGVSVTANDFSPRVELYGLDDGESLARATAATGERTAFFDGIALPANGLYTIVVSGRSRADRGGYSITLQGDGPDNPLPDDLPGPLDFFYGDTVEGTMTEDGADRWNLRGCAGDAILAEVVADGFTPKLELLSPIAELPIATAEGEGETATLRRVLPANGLFNLYVSGTSASDAGDYTLTLTLEGTATPEAVTPETETPENLTPTVISELTPTPTATSEGGPRGRRGTPTPRAGTPAATPTPTAPSFGPTVTATPSVTPDFIMPGVGESAIRVIDVSSEGGPVNHVAYSPDGALLATAGEDGAVRVWAVLRGNLVQTLNGHENRANYVSFSPDDELLASAGDDGTVRLWDQDGNEVAVLEMPDNGVNSVEFSPDSTLLVVTTDAGDVWVWDVADESVLFELEGHAAPSYHALFSPDGALIASGDGLGVVRLWNAEDGELVDALPVNAGPGSGDPILSIAFNSDATGLAVGGVRGVNDAAVQIWDIETGDPIAQLLGHGEWGGLAAVSPDDAYVVSAGRAEPGQDGPTTSTARLWNTNSGDLAVALIGYPAGIVAAAFRPDGDELMTSDGSFVYIWPMQMMDVLAASFGEAVGVQIPGPDVAATPTAPRRTPRATPNATPTHTATPVPTPTQLPTATPTSIPTSIPTSSVPFVSLEIFCTVTTDRLNLRPGPGTNFNPPIDVLELGDLLIVIGRNGDSSWLQVQLLDVDLAVEATGWVSADFLFCVGEVNDAPVVEVES